MDADLDRGRAVLMALGALGASNVATNRVLPPGGYVPWNLAMAASLLWLARRAGADATDLALDPSRLRSGVRTGVTAAGLVAVGYGVATTRGGASALRDRRVTQLSVRRAWFHALVRVPLGTVILEEVAFRSVLPALLGGHRGPDRRSRGLSALLFGLWHVLPSRDLAAANAAIARLERRVGAAGTAGLAVVSTALAGVALDTLGRVGGHLAAPAIAHWASNALGVVAGRLGVRC